MDGIEEERPPPERDDSVSSFNRHTASIFAVSLSPSNPNLACTGGEDDTAWLWNVDSGEEVAKLEGHTDSVVSVEWNCDGKYVATAGMDGKVLVWKDSGEQVVELGGGGEVAVSFMKDRLVRLGLSRTK